jgi:alpha-tubulin suppressor-like RCC1 family protein
LSEDQVYCWGAKDDGRLGTTALDERGVGRVELPEKVRTLSCNWSNACAILESGALWCWGRNAENELGQGITDGNGPVQVAPGTKWSAISHGLGSACGIQQSGDVWCWGRNIDGQVGADIAEVGQQVGQPRRVNDWTDFKTISSTMTGSCAVRAAGGLYCWGESIFGRLATENTERDVYAPERTAGDHLFRQVGTSWFYTCGIDQNFTLRCWGQFGAHLGRSATSPLPGWAPDAVVQPKDSSGKFTQVETGREHTCARSDDNYLWCTGANGIGQLGLGHLDNQVTLERVRLP